MWKKALCLIFAFLLSIESMAAVVSDNDGSAFITKAEFDSLKNNFQSQIDQYNTSIDSKIDVAISSYLSGIEVDRAPENLIDRFVSTTGTKQTWLYELPGIGISTTTNDITQTVDCELAVKKVNNLSVKISKWEGTQDEVSYWWSCVAFSSGTAWNDSYGWYDYFACNASNRVLLLTDCLKGELSPYYYSTDRRKLSLATYGTYPQNTTLITKPSTGSGSGWLWQNFGNGKLVLKYYCNQLYPSFNVIWKLHYYKYFPATSQDYYLQDTGLTITDIVIPENDPIDSLWGATASVGSQASSSTDTTLHNYAQLSSSLVKTSDGNNYLEAVWGVDANTLIYGNDEDTIPELNTSYTELQVSTDTKYQNECWLREGKSTFETSYPSKRQKVRLRNFVLQYVPLYNFCNNTLSNIASELVYVGNGSPCYSCPDNDMETKGKIKLTTTSGTCNCNVRISDKPFDNGNIASGANCILNINTTTDTETTFEMNNKSRGNYYIYISNLTNTNPITIDLFEIKNNKQ